MSSLPVLPSCGDQAAQRIEVSAPRDGHAHGDLIASIYTCAAHTTRAVTVLHTAGLTAYRVPTPGTVLGTRRCGDGMDFTNPNRFRVLTPMPEGDDR